MGTRRDSVCGLWGRKRPLGWEKEEAGAPAAPSGWAVPSAALRWAVTTARASCVPHAPLGRLAKAQGQGPSEASLCTLGSPHSHLLKGPALSFQFPEQGPSTPGLAPGGCSTFGSAPLHPIKPSDGHICTQHAFLQATELSAETR